MLRKSTSGHFASRFKPADHDVTHRQADKREASDVLLVFGLPDDLQRPAVVSLDPVHQLAPVGAVGPDQ